jgi:RHS repeat-associated protein
MRRTALVRLVTALFILQLGSCAEPSAANPEPAEIARSEEPLLSLPLPAQCVLFPPSRIIRGTDGDDTLLGTNQADCIIGYGGNDVIHAGNGDDLVFAGDGADTVHAGSGADSVWLGAGDDIAHGGNQSDKLYGEEGDDKLYGENDSDLLEGGDGNDLLDGGNGKDSLFGQSGDDRLLGANGKDTLSGGDGADYIEAGNAPGATSGGDCHDVILAGHARNNVGGGDGYDACDGSQCEAPEGSQTGCTNNAACGPGERCVVSNGLCVPSDAQRCEHAPLPNPTPDGGTDCSLDAGALCTPTGESDTTCDGVDDDCSCRVVCTNGNEAEDDDGPHEEGGQNYECSCVIDCTDEIDEDYVPAAVTCGQGACVATGMSACVDGTVESSCTPKPPLSATDATCNSVDDDCDGQTDEEFVMQSTSCGVGACAAQGSTTCSSGSVTDSCSPGIPGSQDSTCDGQDDDCSGASDEDFQPVPSMCGIGSCASTGVTECSGGSPTDSCVPLPPLASSDVTCDGVDDDCDGLVDEDYEALPTSCGTGACSAVGTTSCVAGVVLDSCVQGPAAGTDSDCDAIDDDCDGIADDDYTPKATACGVGVCASRGTLTCEDGSLRDSCVPFAASATSDAQCDGLDEDCDGETDEDYSGLTTACGVGGCGATGVTSCEAGVVRDSCVPGQPGASDASCNGVDEDCNGQADEDFQGVHSSCGTGACAAHGSTSCLDGSIVDSCAPGAPAAGDSTCDGVDDDCNGQIDEDFLPIVTSCGVGACGASGITTCASGQVVDTCSPGVPAVSDATCNGIDDDCNGVNDEDYVPDEVRCGTGACVATGLTSCVNGAVVDACSPGAPAHSDATCDGRDDDCDGASDEDYVPTSASCGVGACQRAGTTSCDEGQEVVACTPGSPAASDATCDGMDDNCNGLADEQFVETETTCGDGACAATGFIVCMAGNPVNTCEPGMPGAADGCGGGDDDCDGFIDEDCCQPSTCHGVGANCGTVSDGCGSMIDCGACEVPETCGGGGVSNVCGIPDLPPDPVDVAPSLRPGGEASVYDSVSFLFSGENPIQVGVQPGAIEPRRVATLHGRVLDREGQPLPGARISVHEHPELGFTMSRADGEFDLVMNGGSKVTLEFSRPGYLPAQRSAELDWERQAPLGDVILIRPSPVAAIIDAHATNLQKFEGEVITDDDGTRQPVMLFPPGFSPQVKTGEGWEPLDRITVRITEFTVGERGLEAMPAPLDEGIGYTWAAEFTVDEVGPNVPVQFGQALPVYMENFLGWPKGTIIPNGYYDHTQAVWKAEADGVVMLITDVQDGLAVLDADDDGDAESDAELSAIGFEPYERAFLAQRYPVGSSVWRVPMQHFSTVDWNHPVVNIPPPPPIPTPPPPATDDTCQAVGSIIDCQKGTLMEDIQLAGTDLSLRYNSARTKAGTAAARRLEFVFGSVPVGATSIKLVVTVGGRVDLEAELPPTTTSYVYEWDGRDRWLRPTNGIAEIEAYYSYDLPQDYQLAVGLAVTAGQSFGSWVACSGTAGGFIPPDVRYRAELVPSRVPDPTLGRRGFLSTRPVKYRIGSYNNEGLGLGAWGLSELHYYSPLTKTLYQGDGKDRNVGDLSAPRVGILAGHRSTGTTIDLGDGSAAESAIRSPEYVTVAPDGTVYFLMNNVFADCFMRITPDGVIERVPASYLDPAICSGSGILLTSDAKNRPYLAIAQNLYRMEYTSPSAVKYTRIAGRGRPEDPDYQTVAVTWQEGQPVANRVIGHFFDVALATDGRMYLHTGLPNTIDTNRVIAVNTNGTAETVYSMARSRPGTYLVRGIEVDREGRLLILDNARRQVLSFTAQRGLQVIAGASDSLPAASRLDDGPQDRVRLGLLDDIAVAPNGEVYIIDEPTVGSHRLRRLVHGQLRRMPLQGAPRAPNIAYSGHPVYGRPQALASAPKGQLVIAEMNNHRLLQVDMPFGVAGFKDEVSVPTGDSEAEDTCSAYPPGFSRPAACATLTHHYQRRGSEYAVPSEDGGEFYYFDARGLHVATVDGLTGELIRTFGYDAQARLASITTYNPYAHHIISRQPASEGERLSIADTVLTVTSDGLTRVAYGSSPAPTTSWEFDYFETGLLERMWDPRANQGGSRSGVPYEFTWTYPAAPGGIAYRPVLETDRDPTGSSQTFSWQVTRPVYDPVYDYICNVRYVSGWNLRHHASTVARVTEGGRQTLYKTTKESVQVVDPGTSVPRTELVTKAEVTKPSGEKMSWTDPDSQGRITREGSFRCGTSAQDPCWSEKLLMTEDQRLGRLNQFPSQRIVSIAAISSDGGSPALSRAALTHTVNRTRSSIQETSADPTSALSWTETTSVVAAGVTRTSSTTFSRAVNGGAYTITYTSPEGRLSSASYDAWGKLVESQVAGQTSMRFSYDAQRRLFDISSVKGSDLRATTYAFSQPADRFPSSITSLNDPSRAVTTDMVTDQATGFTTSVTVPEVGTVTMEPTADLLLGALTPPERPRHELAYTKLEQLSSYAAPGLEAVELDSPKAPCPAGLQCYHYNEDRQLVKLTLAGGQSVTRNFAASTGLLSSTVISGQGTTSFTYDADARMTSAIAADGATMSWGYQGKLPVRTTWSGTHVVKDGASTIWTGPINGLLRTVYTHFLEVDRLQIVGGFDAKYARDRDGLVTAVTNNAGGTTVPAFSISRSALDGRVTATALGSVTTTQMYDSSATTPGFGELSGLTATRDSTPLFSTTYTRDKVGRIVQQRQTVGRVIRERNYLYDNAGRLTEARDEAGELVAHWEYDSNGNRTREWTVDDGERVASCADGRATNDLDQLCSYGDRTYVYDANGTLQSVTGPEGTTTYTYDARGLLHKVAPPTGATIRYVYDALGRRIGKLRGASFLKGWLYKDGLRPIAQINAAGAVEATFVYGSSSNVPDYMVHGTTTYRVIADHLGTPRQLVNVATGAIGQRLDVDEFGRVLSDSNPGFQPFGFAGGLYDPDTGLVRFGARDYDPITGRWTARDPILFDAGQANLYAYVGNDPINRTDPTGLDPQRRLECIEDCYTPTSFDKVSKFFCYFACFGDWDCIAQCDIDDIRERNVCKDECVEQDPYEDYGTCYDDVCVACSE